MRPVLFIILFLCVLSTAVYALPEHYELTFFKGEGIPLDNPLIYYRTITFNAFVNDTASFTVEGEQVSLVMNQEHNVKGLTLLLTNGAAEAKITQQDGSSFVGQVAVVTVKQTDSSFVKDDILLANEPKKIQDYDILLKTAGYTAQRDKAVILTVNGKDYVFSEGDEEFITGSVVSVDTIILGEGIASEYPLASVSVSIEKTVDLQWYPYLLSESPYDTILVVGSNTPPSHTLAAGEILLGLPFSEDVDYRNSLDVEVSLPIDENLILIGDPCVNTIVKSLYPDTSCAAELEPGEGYIQLYEDHGRYILLVNGFGDNEMKATGKALRHYDTSHLLGDEEIITTTPSDTSLIIKDESATEILEVKEENQTVKQKQNETKVQQKEKSAEILKEDIIEFKEPETIVIDEPQEKLSWWERFIRWIVSLFKSIFG